MRTFLRARTCLRARGWEGTTLSEALKSPVEQTIVPVCVFALSILFGRLPFDSIGLDLILFLARRHRHRHRRFSAVRWGLEL